MNEASIPQPPPRSQPPTVQARNAASPRPSAAPGVVPPWGDTSARHTRHLGIVRISARGAVSVRAGSATLPRSGGGPRGTVQGFSRASARRLRRVLVEFEGPAGWRVCGITGTIPGPVVTEGEYRRMWNRFRWKVGRMPAAIIWRIELQERGQPHVHGVLWFKRDEWFTVDVAWRAAIGPDRASMPGAFEHAFKVTFPDVERECLGWWRYLAGHQSKTKQAQAGWQGRQWGIIGRPHLKAACREIAYLPDAEWWRVVRCLRRLSGCRYASGRGRQAWFARASDVRRLTDYYGATFDKGPAAWAGSIERNEDRTSE